jgi:hypothetical protein
VGNGPDGKIEVAMHETTLLVKVQGLAKQDNCLGLPDLVEAMIQEGCNAVVFEMSQCCGMDSTFMGVLAFSADALKDDGAKHVLLLNPADRLVKQLKRIGVLAMVQVGTGTLDIPDLRLKPAEDIHFPETERERLKRIKEMHEELVKLNEENRCQFGEVIKAIEEALQADTPPGA